MKHNLTCILTLLCLMLTGLITTGLVTSVLTWAEAVTYTIPLAVAGFIHWKVL